MSERVDVNLFFVKGTRLLIKEQEQVQTMKFQLLYHRKHRSGSKMPRNGTGDVILQVFVSTQDTTPVCNWGSPLGSSQTTQAAAEKKKSVIVRTMRYPEK